MIPGQTEHIGDGAYVHFDGSGFEFRANHHEEPTDRVYIDGPSVLTLQRLISETIEVPVDMQVNWRAVNNMRRDAETKIALVEWMVSVRCHLVEDADITRSDKWAVVDIDGDIVGRGVDPQSAMERAKINVEGTPEGQ